jgi:hypothetical protein
MSTASLSSSTSETIAVSVRECRIIAERVLIVAGVPLGAVPAIRDVVVDAEILELGGMAHLRDDFDHLWPAGAGPLRYRETAWGVLEISCSGRSSLTCAPDVLDLAVSFAHRRGRALLEVRKVFRPELLMGLTASAHLHDVVLGVFPGTLSTLWAMSAGSPSGGATVATSPEREGSSEVQPAEVLVTAVPMQSGEPPEERIARAGGVDHFRALREGIVLDTSLWWELYHIADRALTLDSELSRTHTGSSAFDVHGNVIGEHGEDYEDVPPGTPSYGLNDDALGKGQEP